MASAVERLMHSSLDRRALLQGGLAALALAAAPRSWAANPTSTTIYLQPYGKRLSQKDVDAVEAAFKAFLGADVVELPRKRHPKAAWYKPRKRWRAGVLLDDLAAQMKDKRPADRIVGLTRADISVTKGEHPDWGVLGYGMIDGPACVVSRFRCRMGARSVAHIRERLAKVCLHEVGHTLGSDHCPVQGCLMQDAHGSVRSVDDEERFCPQTIELFKRLGRPVVEAPEHDWA